MSTKKNDWHEWKHHVLHEIKHSNESHEKLFQALRDLDKSVASLHLKITKIETKDKVLNAVFGFFGGSLVMAAQGIIQTFIK